MDRRRFAGRLALGSGAIAALAARSIAADDDQQPSKPQDASGSDPKAKSDEGGERRVEPPNEFLLLTYLMRRFPSEHFDDEAVKGIFGDLRGDVARGRILDRFPLKNSDEPAFVFQAYRSPES